MYEVFRYFCWSSNSQKRNIDLACFCCSCFINLFGMFSLCWAVTLHFPSIFIWHCVNDSKSIQLNNFLRILLWMDVFKCMHAAAAAEVFTTIVLISVIGSCLFSEYVNFLFSWIYAVCYSTCIQQPYLSVVTYYCTMCNVFFLSFVLQY